MVMSSNPTFCGCLVVARPIGALLMNDHRGEDHKVLSVAVADPRFDDIRSLNDLSDHTLLEIQHFFEIYQVWSSTRWRYSAGRTWRRPRRGSQAAIEGVDSPRKLWTGPTLTSVVSSE